MNFKFKMFSNPPGKNKEDKKPNVLDNAPKRPEISKAYSEKREALVKYLNKIQTRHDKDHKLDRIQTSPKIKAEQMERIFNLAEAVQRKIDGNNIAQADFESLLRSINNIYPELVEPLKVSYTNPERGRQLLAAALAALITLSSVGQAAAKTNTPGFTSGVNTTLTFDKHAKTQDDATFDFTKDGYKTEGGGEGGPTFDENSPITLASAYFKTGTVEYKSPEARAQAKRAIHVYLTSVDLYGGGLVNSKIIVKGQSSLERPTDLNDALAEQRTAEGIKLVREILHDYFNGQEIVIESVVESNASIYDDMSEEERAQFESIANSDPEEFKRIYNEKVDSKQSIVVEAIPIKPKPELVKPPEEGLETFAVIVIDDSQSMRNDVSEVRQELKEIKEEKGKDIKTVILDGGNQESHLATLYSTLSKMSKGKEKTKVLVLTDEPDNKLSKSGYDSNISYVLGLARDKNIEITVKVFNPDKTEGGFKTFVLNKQENRNKLLAPVGYYEGQPQIDWYKSL